ncbi:UPF0029-domain-containing protein, partial [Fistulina hepatica ATCC 64428]
RLNLCTRSSALRAIYGDDAVVFWADGGGHLTDDTLASQTIRFEVSLNLNPPQDQVPLKVLVSLPTDYPAVSPPQLQLLSLYVGAHRADADIFGSVLRTFISVKGVEFTVGAVCVFDGLAHVLECCTAWYEERLSLAAAGELVRSDEHEHEYPALVTSDSISSTRNSSSVSADQPSVALPDGVRLFEADPITDRKSLFIGRACVITHPAQVPLILAHLMSNRRIARAAHPIINAWRCKVDNIIHQDNDDDGESAAGGRLAHLLQIMDVQNVLVIVTRYFGGIHLGPDRFKHINQAARNALELGGFLDAPLDSGKKSSARKRH